MDYEDMVIAEEPNLSVSVRKSSFIQAMCFCFDCLYLMCRLVKQKQVSAIFVLFFKQHILDCGSQKCVITLSKLLFFGKYHLNIY